MSDTNVSRGEPVEIKSLSRHRYNGSKTMSNRWRTFTLLSIPLALSGLELSHPSHVSHQVANAFFPVAGLWLTLHIIQFALFAGLTATIFLLTAGCPGISSVTSRVTAILFVICYDLGDAVVGVAAGVLGYHANNLPSSSQSARVEAIAVIFNDPIINSIYTVGRVAWLITMLSAAVAIFIYRRNALAAICIALSGVILCIFDHPGIPGSLAFLLFFIGGAALQAGDDINSPLSFPE